MYSKLAITIPVLWLLSIGVAESADPRMLAESGGYLLGNARRCGVPADRVERAGNVIHDFIVASARDSHEVAAADACFARIFLASAVPGDPEEFPSCAVVIQQFERLEQHHEQTGMNDGTRTAGPGF
jgi:hypothetical protein